MYTIIWLSFFEILLVLFPVSGFTVNTTLHGLLGLGILGFAFYIQRAVRKTSCPDRIKRIAVTTFVFAVSQGVLGLALAAGIEMSWGTLYTNVISFFHVGISIAIITQASSSATAFDMWEEKEFQATPA
jgi:hypothetical protein